MNTKLRCILLDDELPGLTYLKMLCEQLPEVEVVKAYNNPESLIKDLPTLDFDLCILDIEMPGYNGLQVANLLRGKAVIFTTAYKEHAAEAFDLDAIDYVQKPVKMERLHQAIAKAMVRLNSKEQKKTFVQLNTDQGKALIFFNQLGYVKASPTDSRDKVAVLIDGSSILLKNVTFSKLEEVLPPAEFVRINKSEMIALQAVKVFSFDEITTSILSENGKPLRLNLSESFRAEFLNRIKI
ncbi:MAG: response regulator transcription factor [Algoriphagus sp.]|nr:response regulator transcription factor [Algoriphagus sp.]